MISSNNLIYCLYLKSSLGKKALEYFKTILIKKQIQLISYVFQMD